MKKININFLIHLVGSIGGLADDDYAFEHFQKYDLNNSSAYRKIIQDYIIPDYNRNTELMKEKMRDALSFALSKKGYPFEREFYSNLPPFDAPSDPRDFYLWIWEELFGSEPYLIEDLSDYTEVDDPEEPLYLDMKQ